MSISSGDWVVLEDRVSQWVGHRSSKAHRYIVVRERLGQVVLLARSTDLFSYSGLAHDAHFGACGVRDCKIDHDGRISPDPVPLIDVRHVEHARSCHEPSEDVIEWVLSHKGGRR